LASAASRSAQFVTVKEVKLMDCLVPIENLRAYADPVCPDCFGKGYFVELATAYEPGDAAQCDCVTIAVLAGRDHFDELPVMRTKAPLHWPLAA
jgi:hypothetical protein